MSNEGQITTSSDSDELRYVGEEGPCPYLPGRLARHEAYWVDQLDGSMYESLMGRGFRRSGFVVYRPRCRGCSACQPIRVPIANFERSRSMERVWRRNADLRVEVDRPASSRRKFQLFRAYLEHRHNDAMARTLKTFEEFLYESPTDTLEFCYFSVNRLVAVSIADRCPGGLSSVYMYSDPQEDSRSLGTYSVLWEIEWCRQQRLEYYYLGYFVPDSRTMAYKARFRPHEILRDEGNWVPNLRIVG